MGGPPQPKAVPVSRVFPEDRTDKGHDVPGGGPEVLASEPVGRWMRAEFPANEQGLGTPTKTSVWPEFPAPLISSDRGPRVNIMCRNRPWKSKGRAICSCALVAPVP